MKYWIKSKSEELKSKAEQQQAAAAAAVEQQQRLLETKIAQVKADKPTKRRHRKDKDKSYTAQQRQEEVLQAPHVGWSRTDGDDKSSSSSRKHKRKKDKGKEAHRSKRKEKQQQQAAMQQQQELLEAQLAQLEIDSQPTTASNSTYNTEECEHGLALYDYDDYVSVHDFVKDFVDAYNDSISLGDGLGQSLIAAYHATKEEYANLWKGKK